MVAGVALFLLGPVYLSPLELSTDIGFTVTHVSPYFGMRVDRIVASCTLWRCGLRQNDCIVSVNGCSTMNLDPHVAITLFLQSRQSEPLTMHVLRGLPGTKNLILFIAQPSTISAIAIARARCSLNLTRQQPTYPRVQPSSLMCSCTFLSFPR
jgi:hypothetical protein